MFAWSCKRGISAWWCAGVYVVCGGSCSTAQTSVPMTCHTELLTWSTNNSKPFASLSLLSTSQLLLTVPSVFVIIVVILFQPHLYVIKFFFTYYCMQKGASLSTAFKGACKSKGTGLCIWFRGVLTQCLTSVTTSSSYLSYRMVIVSLRSSLMTESVSRLYITHASRQNTPSAMR